MTTTTEPTTDLDLAARAEALALLDRLAGSNRRDRAAFTLGYILALDAMADDIHDADLEPHVARAQALNALCHKDFHE